MQVQIKHNKLTACLRILVDVSTIIVIFNLSSNWTLSKYKNNDDNYF